ncbi:MAG: hypothetical protein Tsb0021_04010 [Chlamydiales bacterium]
MGEIPPVSTALENLERHLNEIDRAVKEPGDNEQKIRDLLAQIQEDERDFQLEANKDISGKKLDDSALIGKINRAIEIFQAQNSSVYANGNLPLSLARIIQEIKTEIQILKEKVIVERAGPTELGGGLSQK